MSYAIDTNLFVRSLHVNHPQQQNAKLAISTLLAEGEMVSLFPQNLYELWVVATRPIAQNGLGLDVYQTVKELARLKSTLVLLPDTPPIYSAWEKLVSQHLVLGRNAHDARIAAAMQVHEVTHLLTFNGGDFKRYQHITVVTPDEILNPQTS